MNLFNTAVVRFAQALVGLFFVLVVSGYFGLLLLFPLGVIFHLTNLLSGIGLNGIVAFLFSLPISGTLFYYGYKIEGLYQTILHTGIELIKIAKNQVLAFDKLLPGQQANSDSDSGIAPSN